jgi:hypothetical protein
VPLADLTTTFVPEPAEKGCATITNSIAATPPRTAERKETALG